MCVYCYYYSPIRTIGALAFILPPRHFFFLDIMKMHHFY